MSTKTKEIEKLTKTKVITEYICDVCKKSVEPNQYGNNPEEWHSLNTNHHGWGNDSCESYEYYDICSPECYFILMRKCCGGKDYELGYEFDEIPWKFAKKIIEYIEMLKQNQKSFIFENAGVGTFDCKGQEKMKVIRS